MVGFTGSDPGTLEAKSEEATMKVSRNQRCPCGSGRKYKQCCLAKDEADEREALEIAARRVENPFAPASVFRLAIDRVRGYNPRKIR